MLPLSKKYRAPKCGIGQLVECRRHGKVRVDAISDSPVPWPATRAGRVGGGKLVPILCGELVEAVRVEPAQAVARGWGVSRWTVQRWRRALGVPRFNEGTTRVWKLAAGKLDAKKASAARWKRKRKKH